MNLEDTPEFRGGPSEIEKLVSRLAQRIEQGDYPPVLFDILAPSRKGAFEELYDALQRVYENSPLSYAGMYEDGTAAVGPWLSEGVLPNVMTPDCLSSDGNIMYLELTHLGNFRAYSIFEHSDGKGHYELRGIRPATVPLDANYGLNVEMVEAQANIFLGRIPYLLQKGMFRDPIRRHGRNTTFPENPDLVLP